MNNSIKYMPEQFVVNQDDHLLDIDGAKLAYFHRYTETVKTMINMTGHCVVYILKGEKIFQSKEGLVHLKKGELAFIKKGLYLNTEKFMDEGQFESITFFLQEELLKKFAEKNRELLMYPNKELDLPEMYTIKGSLRISSYFDSLIPYFNEHVKNAALLKLKFEELLLNLITHDTSQVFRNFLCQMNVERKFSFKQFMEQHYDKYLSVNELAFLSGMSLSSFKRAFKESFNEPPGKWLKTKRLSKSKNLLEQTDKTIGEICDLCGYISDSHFINDFKMKYGNSPSKYRKALVG